MLEESEDRFKSLDSQIIDAEMQVQEHQQRLAACKDALIHKARERIATPSSLLLAGGMGFIISELTKNKSSKSHSGEPGKSSTFETADISKYFMNAMNLLNTVNALYTNFRASMREREM